MMMQTEFKVPKRRDEITEWTLLAGIGYERELRYEKSQNVTPWLKPGYNYVEIGKTSQDDPTTYACGIYVCKAIKPFEIIDSVTRFEQQLYAQRFLESYAMLLKTFATAETIDACSVSI